jgi:hypothetical protein
MFRWIYDLTNNSEGLTILQHFSASMYTKSDRTSEQKRREPETGELSHYLPCTPGLGPPEYKPSALPLSYVRLYVRCVRSLLN